MNKIIDCNKISLELKEELKKEISQISVKLKNSNYLSNNFQWRLISPRNDNSFSTNMVSFVGANDGHYAARAYGIRPTLYLKQNVKIAFGTGAVSNPYILTF